MHQAEEEKEEAEEGGIRERGRRARVRGGQGAGWRRPPPGKQEKPLRPFVSSTIGTVSWATGEPCVGGGGGQKRRVVGGWVRERDRERRRRRCMDGWTESAVSFTAKRCLKKKNRI